MDKVLHALTFFGLTLFWGGILHMAGLPHPWAWPIVPLFVAGLWKEWTDPRRGGQRELLDVVANAVGIAAGAATVARMF